MIRERGIAVTVLRFTVPPEWDRKTLREFLQTAHGVSGTTLKRAKRLPLGITQNGEHCRTVDLVHAGAEITVTVAEEEHAYRPYALDVPVLYEDESTVVFDKPAGLPVHPSLGHPYDTLANVYAARPQTADCVFHPLNRLDRDTTGIVLVAKNAHAAYNTALVKKIYLAVLCGVPREMCGTLDLPIGREGEDTQRRIVRPDGQRAVTKYRVFASKNGFSVAAVRIFTGRTHQIRVHMAHIGCPLLGDTLYGSKSPLINRQALHCTSLTWTHPMTGESIETLSPAPADMLAAANALGFTDTLRQNPCQGQYNML